ncbi:MAG: branched-chain amino acid ABC transporter permease, partial [Acetobacteraceae bacterium]|nr:branched-chain amino acid ABC transporter permease [Acetobacteraceae bacterium]
MSWTTTTVPAAAGERRVQTEIFGFTRAQGIALVIMVALIVWLPFVVYPIFLMRVLTTALFACAFNLMIGYVGLLSFGHAAFYGMGAYLAAWTL